MTIGERIIEAFGGVTSSELESIRELSYNRGYEAAVYDGGNDDPATSQFKSGGQNYKRISDRYVRDGAVDFQEAIKTAWELWQKSPIAKRVLVMKRDHIVGTSAEPQTKNAKIDDVLTRFWKKNKLKKRVTEFTHQLFLFGEQCYPVFVREADGRVSLGYIDPYNIVDVVKHPDNSMEDWAVIVKRNEPGLGIKKLVYRIIREDEDYIDEVQLIPSEHEGMLVTAQQATIQPWEAGMIAEVKGLRRDEPVEYDGSCFYFKVNAVSNQSRGMSDLLQVADWVDQADEVLFALADKERMANYFVWFIKLIGANEEQVKTRRNEIAAKIPRQGQAYIHNDSEEPSLNSPDLNQSGTIETFRAILGLILGGMGYPVHWFGFGDEANLAVGAVQANPTEKTLEHDQGIVEEMFVTMCLFSIHQVIMAGDTTGLDSEKYETINLNLPEVSTKDTVKVTASLTALVQVLVVAQEKGWLTEETAVQILAKLFIELGIDIDPAEELKKAQKEKEERDMKEEQRRNDALNSRLNGPNGDNGNGQNGGISRDELIKIMNGV